ncbi:MAG: hypothetical protein JSS30_02940 [Verrucomicrobia bacterium]|nr:hypothetical protein [Verrucomicrobiota bacterium]
MDPKIPIKGIEGIEAAMQYYKEKQLHPDHPMQELINSNELLEQRMNRSFN